jgi:hypothetical protein
MLCFSVSWVCLCAQNTMYERARIQKTIRGSRCIHKNTHSTKGRIYVNSCTSVQTYVCMHVCIHEGVLTCQDDLPMYGALENLLVMYVRVCLLCGCLPVDAFHVYTALMLNSTSRAILIHEHPVHWQFK